MNLSTSAILRAVIGAMIGTLVLPVSADELSLSFDARSQSDLYSRIRNRQFPLCIKMGRVKSPQGFEEASSYRCLKAVTSENDETVVAVFGPESAFIKGWGPEVYGEKEAGIIRQQLAELTNAVAILEQQERNLFVTNVRQNPDAMACYQRNPACRARWDHALKVESHRLKAWVDYYRNLATSYDSALKGIQLFLSNPVRPTVAPSAPSAPAGGSQGGLLGQCMPNDPACR